MPWVVEQWIRQNVNTCLPGIVESYDPETKRADVTPAANTLLSAAWQGGQPPAPDAPNESIRKAVILNVPVLHPSGGGYSIHFPLRRGDPVMLLFSQRGLDGWKQTLSYYDPPLDSFYAMREAVAIPGFGPLAIAPAEPDALTLQTDDGETAVVIAPGHVDIRSARLTHNGQDVGDSHVHGGVTPGGGQTGVPA